MRHEDGRLFYLYIEVNGPGSARQYGSESAPWSAAEINEEAAWLRWLWRMRDTQIHLNVRLAA